MTADTIPPPPSSDDAPKPKRKRGPSITTLKRHLADRDAELAAARDRIATYEQAALSSLLYAQDARAAVEEQLEPINQKLDELHRVVVAMGKHVQGVK